MTRMGVAIYFVKDYLNTPSSFRVKKYKVFFCTEKRGVLVLITVFVLSSEKMQSIFLYREKLFL